MITLKDAKNISEIDLYEQQIYFNLEYNLIDYQKLKETSYLVKFTLKLETWKKMSTFPVLVNNILQVLLSTLGEKISIQETSMFNRKSQI